MFGHMDPLERQELLESGTRAMAEVLESRAGKHHHGETEWHFRVAWPKNGEDVYEASFKQLLPEHATLPGKKVPILFDPNEPTRCMVDVGHLADPDPMAAPRLRFSGGGMHVARTPRWIVPAECPNCGAAVDQATASLASDPHCGFCEQPLPVQPAPAAAPPPTVGLGQPEGGDPTAG